jgi:signal transduction histidine kinase/tetratricopeptide (TPR) repeat protein/ActR/RegA family two-component response regulator
LKKEFLKLFCLLLIPLTFYAQDLPDSLSQKLQNAKGEDRALVLNEIAWIIVRDDPAAALKFAEEALSLARKSDNTQQHIESLLNIGDSYYYQDNFTLSEKYFKDALQLSQKAKLGNLTARSFYYLAFQYDYLNNPAKARKYYTQAIQIYDSLKNFKKVADLSFDLAELHSKKGENAEAKEYYEKSLAYYDTLGLKNDVAEILNSLGVLYLDLGNYEKAIAYYNRSLTIMQEIESPSGIAQILNNLGTVYYDWGNLEEALIYFLEALQIETEMKDDYGIAIAYNNIGNVYADRKDNTKAIDYYEKSLLLYEKTGDKSGIATALNNLGELYADTGETGIAIIMLKKSLKLQKEIADIYGIAFAHNTLSEVYLKAGNLKLSRQYNDSSYACALETGYPEILTNAYEIYAKLYEAEGNATAALEYYKKHTAIKDSLINQRLQKQIAEVKAQYELEKKEQKIELLSSKDRLNRLELINKQNVVRRQRIILTLTIAGFIAILIVMLILRKQIKQKKAAYKTLNEQNKQILKGREELLIAKEKAEESDKLKSTFLSNMSHELRTPLNGILGFTDILRMEIPQEEFRNMAEIIHSSGNRLLDTLNSIIDLSIIESNKMEVEIQEIHLNEFISERISLFSAAATKKNIGLDFEVDHENTVISTDRKVLNSLLNNLIDNAIKYTEKGKVNVLASIFNKDGGHWLKLRVIDTGIGIEEKKIKNIFEKFRQGSEGHGRQFEGAGLGLTICKKYVEILNGEIMIESKFNEGSVFTVHIPVKLKKMPIKKIAPPKPDSPVPDHRLFNLLGPSSNLLIVENDEINLTHLLYILQDMCNVEAARNGNEAVAKAGSRKFHVILMDINLGAGMNGMDTAKTIRKIEGYQNTPIIAVTANAMKGHKEEFLANGCTHYISKPFSADKLRALILEAVNETF